VHRSWDTATVVCDGNGIVFVDEDIDMVTITGERLIDGVIYNVVYEVVKAFDAYVSYLHFSSFSYCF